MVEYYVPEDPEAYINGLSEYIKGVPAPVLELTYTPGQEEEELQLLEQQLQEWDAEEESLIGPSDKPEGTEQHRPKAIQVQELCDDILADNSWTSRPHLPQVTGPLQPLLRCEQRGEVLRFFLLPGVEIADDTLLVSFTRSGWSARQQMPRHGQQFDTSCPTPPNPRWLVAVQVVVHTQEERAVYGTILPTMQHFTEERVLCLGPNEPNHVCIFLVYSSQPKEREPVSKCGVSCVSCYLLFRSRQLSI